MDSEVRLTMPVDCDELLAALLATGPVNLADRRAYDFRMIALCFFNLVEALRKQRPSPPGRQANASQPPPSPCRGNGWTMTRPKAVKAQASAPDESRHRCHGTTADPDCGWQSG